MSRANEMPLQIYVAGPFSAETQEGRDANCKKAKEIGLALALKGHYVHVPHAATEFMDGVLDYEYFMGLDLSILALWADALYFVGPSPGADRELAAAKQLDMPIYRGLDEVPDFEGERVVFDSGSTE